ncbi:MAG: tetratricopeptide repeat protein, partial [Chloroflexota bacterium]|nr:tetratricopeptide repeat protein [Chloroflexota bacterium]
NQGLEKRARSLVGRGKIKEAIEHVEDAQKKDPSDWYPAYLHGWILQADSQYSEALKAYRIAENLAPDNSQLKAVLGELLLAIDKEELALPYLEACVHQWPSSAEANSLYGTALLRLNQFAAAEEALIKSCGLSEHNPDARAGLLELYKLTSRQHLSRSLLDNYVRDAPDLASSHAFLAEHIIYQEGDCEDACPHFEKAIEHYRASPNPAWFMQYLSTLNYPDTIVDSYLDALVNCGYFQLAENVARDHLELARFKAFRARLLLRKGDFEAAAKLLKAAIEQDSGEPGIRITLSQYHLLNGDPRAAEKEIRSAIEMAEGRGFDEPWYWGIMAVSLLEQSKKKDAEELIQQVETKNQARFRYSMIYTFDQIENWEAVIAGCRQVLESDHDNPRALHFLAKALFHQNQPEEAVEVYNRLLGHQPNNGNALLEIGMAYKRAGRVDNAKSAYEHALSTGKLSRPQQELAHQELQNLNTGL